MNGFCSFRENSVLFSLPRKRLANEHLYTTQLQKRLRNRCNALFVVFSQGKMVFMIFYSIMFHWNPFFKYHYKQHVDNICGKCFLCWQHIVRKCAWVFQLLDLAFLSIKLIFSYYEHGCSYGRELEQRRSGPHNGILFPQPIVQACSIFHLYCVDNLKFRKNIY